MFHHHSTATRIKLHCGVSLAATTASTAMYSMDIPPPRDPCHTTSCMQSDDGFGAQTPDQCRPHPQPRQPGQARPRLAPNTPQHTRGKLITTMLRIPDEAHTPHLMPNTKQFLPTAQQRSTIQNVNTSPVSTCKSACICNTHIHIHTTHSTPLLRSKFLKMMQQPCAMKPCAKWNQPPASSQCTAKMPQSPAQAVTLPTLACPKVMDVSATKPATTYQSAASNNVQHATREMRVQSSKLALGPAAGEAML
jgi:hypothetical protein